MILSSKKVKSRDGAEIVFKIGCWTARALLFFVDASHPDNYR
jgi:hypothetical protein